MGMRMDLGYPVVPKRIKRIIKSPLNILLVWEVKKGLATNQEANGCHSGFLAKKN